MNAKDLSIITCKIKDMENLDDEQMKLINNTNNIEYLLEIIKVFHMMFKFLIEFFSNITTDK